MEAAMTEVRWDGGAVYEMVLRGRCDAPPEDVYDVLADLSTHVDWAGERQYPGFRLVSLDGAGPVEPGTPFTSVGSIPMALSRWENRNKVVEARSPEVLEFHTGAVVRWRTGRRTEARYEHRYEIEPDGTGSRVVYRLRQTAIANPPLRMRLPLMRTITHRKMIPLFCGRGFANLLHAAELYSTSGAPYTRSLPVPSSGGRRAVEDRHAGAG
jgi:Polyketide cyclase / dehydrase and lipid transport